MKKELLLLLFIITGFNSFAQFNFVRKDSIQVVLNSDTILHPWAGGFNNPQFSQIDLNQDGIKDVFVFDRSCDEVRTFVYKTIDGSLQLVHDPSYENSFPIPSMRYRTALVDFDCDGLEDLFTYFIGGLQVYKNISTVGTGLQWELAYQQIKSDQHGTYTNAYVSSGDIPAIVDVDGDGDIDLLSFSVGGEVLQYHRNLAMENFGRCDTLVFELRNDCWGKFREDATTNSIILDNNEQPCNGVNNVPFPEKTSNSHVGSTVLALDIDNSGVLDLVLGDATYNNLVLLTNSGGAVNANSVMTGIDTSFPSNSTPADITVFPASFYLDLDNDGIKDLVAAPNYKGQSNNVQSAWWYKNTGLDNAPVFNFQSEDFLQADMIDVGNGAIPVYFDYNSDGKEDLIISNFYNYVAPDSKESKLFLYENVGTQLNPIFKLVDSDYLGLGVSSTSLRKVPTFGDIDNDGDLDMYLGDQLGSLQFYRNSAGPGNIANFSLETNEVLDNTNAIITAGSFSSPLLFDLNNDQKLDLIIGDKLGKLRYYQNTGSTSNPVFTLITLSLGNVDVSPASNEGYAHPQLVKVNDTLHLFVGARDGYIHYYDSLEGNIADGNEFNLVSHTYLDIHNGTYSAIAIKDIDNDQHLDFLCGNDLGGVAQFKGEFFINDVGINEYTTDDFQIYPNPTSSTLNIALSNDAFLKMKGQNISILDMQGRLVATYSIYSKQSTLDLSDLVRGAYLIKIDGTTIVKKIMKN
jgi:hypothetical protein